MLNNASSADSGRGSRRRRAWAGGPKNVEHGGAPPRRVNPNREQKFRYAKPCLALTRSRGEARHSETKLTYSTLEECHGRCHYAVNPIP